MIQRIITFFALIFLPQLLLNAQDIKACEMIVQKTIESINSKSADNLTPHLANDFTIAGQTGDIAKMIFPQLFSQLNDKVLSSKLLTQKTNQHFLELVYQFEYEGMGIKETIFQFNGDNKMTALTLFEMQVKTKESETKIERNNDNIIEVPFKMAGNLILVDAKLNGQKASFLLDSGAPVLILNAKADTGHISASGAMGAGGKISGIDIKSDNNFNWAGISIKNQDLMSMDLSHLEIELDVKISGLIGYEVIKNYDLLFDYKKKILTLIRTDYLDQYLAEDLAGHKLSYCPFEMEAHIPVFKAEIGGKIYAFGLDSGAELNLISDGLYPVLMNQFNEKKVQELSGADQNVVTVKSGSIKKTYLAKEKYKNMNTVFSDISHLNAGYGLKLDGLMGYELLKRQKTILSFKRNTLIFVY